MRKLAIVLALGGATAAAVTALRKHLSTPQGRKQADDFKEFWAETRERFAAEVEKAKQKAEQAAKEARDAS